MELITDLQAIRKVIGLRLEESSFYPKRNLDVYILEDWRTGRDRKA